MLGVRVRTWTHILFQRNDEKDIDTLSDLSVELLLYSSELMLYLSGILCHKHDTNVPLMSKCVDSNRYE